MNTSFKLAVVSLCIVMGAAFDQAQAHTNYLTIHPQNLVIALTGYASSGGGASAFKIANTDVLKALGFTDSRARLHCATAEVPDGTNTTSTVVFFVTTNSTNGTNIDVTKFFSLATDGATLTRNTTEYGISLLGFGVDTSGNVLTNSLGNPLSQLTFLVQGYAKVQNSGAFNLTVNGPGASGGTTNLVLKGTISASAPTSTTNTLVQIIQ